MSSTGPDSDSDAKSSGFEVLFEHTSDCIVEGSIQDGEPIVHRVNDAFENVFGYTNSELRGENLNDFITPDGKRDEVEAVDEAIREGDIGPREVTRQTADGPREFLLRATGGEGQLSYAIYTDITAQKERERKLERYERIVENVPVGIYRITPGPLGTHIFGNQALLDLIGASSFEELSEYYARDLYVDPNERAEFSERLLKTGELTNEELKLQTIEGEEFWASVSDARVVDEEEEAVYFEGTIRDITDQKERERKLRRFKRAVEATGHVIFITDPDGTIEYVNQAFEEITGYSADEAVGRTPRILKSGEMSEEYFENLWMTILGGETWSESIINRRKSGELYHASQTIAPIVVEGEVTAFVATQTDITERKEREEELRKREQELERAHEQLRQIIDLIPDPLFVKNRDDEVLLTNEANADLLGSTPEEVEGKPEPEIMPDLENYEEYRQRDIEVIERGDSTTVEEELSDPGGDSHIFKITRIPFKTSDTEEDAVLGYARDVTDLKEYEQELEETKRTLEQSNEKLDQFASVVSHDLRNPLNVIKGRTELLRQEASEEHVEPIERSVERMEAMIDDLLTLSRVGQSVDEPAPLSLTTVVADSWAAVSSDGLELDVDATDDVEVEADGDRLPHVFENLFRNAKEHNDPPVAIRVGTLSDEMGAVSGFFVADNGAGIPESDREKVFEYGYTTNADGTGFGLSIVEEIVEAHGWTISVGDSDARGARFEVDTTGQS